VKPVFRAGIAALCLSLNISGPVKAENSGSHQIEMSATVGPVCVLPAPEPTANSNANYTNGKLTINQLIDNNNALVRASSVTLRYKNAMCNYNGTITVASEKAGLTRDGQVSDQNGAFMSVIPYKITGTWGDINLPTLDTTARNIVTQQSGGANLGDLVLTVSTDPSTRPALEGKFSDVIVVKIGQVM
jgi:hypothetical protein